MRVFLVCLLFVTLPTHAAQSLRILLTNDDGYDAPGIQAIHQALIEAGHDVFLIAPATQQSGASASVTAGGVEVTRHEGKVWAVSGKPADAVRFGLGYVMYERPPDLVVSGANFGQNVGRDVNVSGTVGAAITAWHLGIPAISVSVGLRFDEAEKGFPTTFGAFDSAARVLVRIINNMDLDDMTAVLNVNYPAARPLDVRGVRWTELSDHSVFSQRYYRKADGTYAPEFQGTDPHARAKDAESLADGFVTLTFLDGDMSVPVRRGQKYLADHLLDRDYRVTSPPGQTPAPRNSVKRTSKEKIEQVQKVPVSEAAPKAVTEAVTEQEVTSPAEVEEIAEPEIAKPEIVEPEIVEPEIVEPEIVEPKIAEAEVAEPVIPETSVTEKGEQSVIEEAESAETISQPDIDPILEGIDEPPPVEDARAAPPRVENVEELENAPEAGTESEADNKKPDSWLRRIFNPSSWRR